MVTKIFIGGLPAEMDEMGIAELTGPFGNIVTIKLVRDKVSKKSKGYAFVEMTTLEAAENVIAELNGTMIKDKVLEINIQEDLPSKPKSVYHKQASSKPLSKPKRPRLSR